MSWKSSLPTLGSRRRRKRRRRRRRRRKGSGGGGGETYLHEGVSKICYTTTVYVAVLKMHIWVHWWKQKM
jgi:hypothetical protein